MAAIGFLPPEVVASGSSLILPAASLYEFGVLASALHMAWMRYTGGRMKSDYQYSSQIVYNNFPWPKSPKVKQMAVVEAKAHVLLKVRETFSSTSLAALYTPETMPGKLAKAHAELDRAVDACYRAKPFDSDRERVEFLFALYEKLTAPLTAGLKDPRPRSKKATKA